MKKTGILNARLMGELTQLRHFDTLVICDIGFPIPKNANVVDLSLVAGIPTFMQTLKAVLNEVIFAKYTIFDFMEEANQEYYDELHTIFKNQEAHTASMDAFRRLSADANLFIRTGETRPASNILLEAASGDEWSVATYGVSFDDIGL